jgi:hypothetical protein
MAITKRAYAGAVQPRDFLLFEKNPYLNTKMDLKLGGSIAR